MKIEVTEYILNHNKILHFRLVYPVSAIFNFVIRRLFKRSFGPNRIILIL